MVHAYQYSPLRKVFVINVSGLTFKLFGSKLNDLLKGETHGMHREKGLALGINFYTSASLIWRFRSNEIQGIT